MELELDLELVLDPEVGAVVRVGWVREYFLNSDSMREYFLTSDSIVYSKVGHMAILSHRLSHSQP